MEGMESMNKVNREFEQEVDFLEKQIKDMKWKFNIQESINKEATEKLVNEIEELKLLNKVQEKEYKEKEIQGINDLNEYKTKYEEMECLKEKRIKDLSQSNVYLAEKLSKTRKYAKRTKDTLEAQIQHLEFQLTDLNHFYIGNYEKLENNDQVLKKKHISLMNELKR